MAEKMKAGYRVKREVRIPQLRMQPGQEYPVRILEEMHTEPSRDEKRKGDVTLTKVIDLETGEVRQIVCGTVLANLLNEEPGGYVGKCYLIEVGELSSEDGWRQFYLYEIEDPAELEGEGMPS